MSQQPPRKPRQQHRGGRSSRALRALGHAGRHWEALGGTGSLPTTLPQRGSSLMGSVPGLEPRFPSGAKPAPRPRGRAPRCPWRCRRPGGIPTGAGSRRRSRGLCRLCGLGGTARRGARGNYSYCCGYFWLPCCRCFRSSAGFAACGSAARAGAGGSARRGGDASRWGPPGAAATGARGWAGRRFEARFIRAEQKAPCAARPRSAADGAACHYARTGSREAPGCQKNTWEGDNPLVPPDLRGSPQGCPHCARVAWGRRGPGVGGCSTWGSRCRRVASPRRVCGVKPKRETTGMRPPGAWRAARGRCQPERDPSQN